MSIDAIATYIRKHYSAFGVEVGAIGQRSITVSLPEEMPITAFVADLWNNFQATVEIKHVRDGSGSSLVVWLCLDNAGAAEYGDTVEGPALSVFTGMCLAVFSLMLGSVATNPKLYTDCIASFYNFTLAQG